MPAWRGEPAWPAWRGEPASRGFTIIELIIVAGVIAFLLVLVWFAIQPQTGKGRDARRKSDLSRIQVALEDYYNDKECYPPQDMLNCNPGTNFRPYLNKVPCDPVTGTSYYYQPETSTCPSWYKIYTKLEHGRDSAIEKVGCSGGCGPAGAYNYGVSSANITLETGTGTGGGGGATSNWGCKNGVCVQLSFPKECVPNYNDQNCSGQCGAPKNECQ